MRRLTILLAAVALGALLVAPAANAATGTSKVHVKLTGTGAGKAYIEPGLEFYRGSPEIKCTYASPGPQAGTCDTFMGDEGEGWEQVVISFEASPGSKLLSVTTNDPEVESCGNLPGSETKGVCTPYVEPGLAFEEEFEVTATFDAEPPTFTHTVVVLGEGTVVSNPPGIVCPPTCGANFAPGSTVKLTASPAAGWALSAWSGCAVKIGFTCEVLMSEAKTVMVTFVQTPSLTIEKAGTGYGKVATTGISCDESCSKSTAGIKTGAAVTVKATAAKGSEFAGFEGGTGNASSCSATCTFTISEASSVKAKFSPIPTKTLAVELTGPGAYKGKVTGKAVTVKGAYSTALSCGMGCTSAVENFFATGTTELVATPAFGYTFAGWTVEGGSAGTCTGTTTPCTLLTDADKTVKAKFE